MTRRHIYASLCYGPGFWSTQSMHLSAVTPQPHTPRDMDCTQAADELRLRCSSPKTIARSSVARSWTTTIFRFLLPTLAAATPSMFLDMDVRDAWAALITEGKTNEEGAWGLVQAMLADCSTREGSTWDTGCDRAMYLDTMMKKNNAASAAAAEGPQIYRDPLGEEMEEEWRELQDKAADPIEVVLASNLSFSSFFLDFAVSRRPVILLSDEAQRDFEVEDSKTTGSKAKYNDSSDLSSSEQDSPTPDDAVGSIEGSLSNDLFSVGSNVVTCAPRVEGSVAEGTVEGLLRDCPASVLASFVVPPHVAGDFTQRFRKQGVLPKQDLPAVERFVSGWQTIHRTRQGSSIPATACPAGANALISVISSALEVLVYTADALPALRPTYGGAPCPGGENSTATSDIVFDGNYTTEDRVVNSDGRADQNGLVDLGSDDEKRGHSTKEEERKDGEFSSGEYISGKWPHEPRYCAKLWPEEGDRRNGSSATAAPRQEEGQRENVMDVFAGDMLFVPSGGAVAWRAKGAEDEAVIARFCYVDASNFNDVKAQLPLYAAVEAGASGLLRAFRSPAFDVSMNRKPSAVLATDFFSVDRQDAGASIPSSVNEADVRQRRRLLREKHGGKFDGLEPSLDSFHLSDPSSSTDSSSSSSSYVYSDSDSGGSGSRQGGRGRRSRGRKSFKEWQDDARWDLKVLGLTLPTLEAPNVTECGRTRCTVEWTSGFPFVKNDEDQTKIGFNITFVPTMMVNHNASLSYEIPAGYMEMYIGDERLKSEHSLERELLNLGITDGKRYKLKMDDANLLVPDTSYRFAVSIVYGETGGPFSELSKPARTAKITAPLPLNAAPEGSPEEAHSVTLSFHPPPDDGGSLLSWYHVMLRPAGENLLNKWQAVGIVAATPPRKGSQRDAVTVKVDNLVPGVAYQFRVCAQNEVGTSPWSAPSAPVIVKRAASQDSKNRGFLNGFHSGHRYLRLPNVTQASVTYAGETQPPPGEGFDPFEWEVVHGPVIVLDDRAGKVHVNESSIDVWTSHFSPKSFAVKAELVVAKPANANRALENGRFIRNRVALVERGTTPIVHKVLNAQRAGALGVIIADDGRCRGSFDQLCVYGSNPPDGWASLDLPRPWLEVRVPVVLMLEEDASRLMTDARAAEQEAEGFAWSSLYDGWMDSSIDAGWEQ